MNKKEVSELRRRFKKDQASFTRVTGCYVDANKNKVCNFNHRFLNLEDVEFFKYLEIAKKSLAGKVGNNLLNLEFPLEEEGKDGKQYSLMALKESKLENEDLLNAFYDHVIDTYDMAGNFLILLFHDVYDVMLHSANNENMDISEECYEYLICAICPVALSKPGLGYKTSEHTIGAREQDWVVGVPETAFLFPAFNDRSTDIHSLLFYTKNTKEPHTEFMELGLGCPIKTTLTEKKESFETIIKEAASLENVDSDDVMLDIQQSIMLAVEEYEDTHSVADPELVLDKTVIKSVLKDSNYISEDKVDKLTNSIDKVFGEEPPIAEDFVNMKDIEKNLLRLEKMELEKRVAVLEKQIEVLKKELSEK